MKHVLAGVVGVGVAVTLAGCGGGADGGEERADGGSAGSASAYADTISAAVTEIGDLVPIDETNDPNDLIGRPNGYDAAVVLYDERVACEQLSVDCGATIEEWGGEVAAQARSDYIQGLQSESPMLGSEYDYVRGNVLLRVSGELPPSVADAYERAFTSQD